jgi:hypothetical protein
MLSDSYFADLLARVGLFRGQFLPADRRAGRRLLRLEAQAATRSSLCCGIS